MEKSAHKLELQRRIAELEKKQLWHLDVEDDPETYPLMPDDVDYLNEKLSSRIKNKIANIMGARFFDKLIADRRLIIKEVRGIENFKAVNGGKIVTCNHFSVGDNYAVWVALRDHMDGRLLYKVIREGNYTNPPKPFGLFMRHCNTLPLSSQLPTMKKFLKAVSVLLGRGETILIYPEQAMWYNYRKPRPPKPGAYHFAAKLNAPVVSCFVEMIDLPEMDTEDFYRVKYRLHVLGTIYPDPDASLRENTARLAEADYALKRAAYERIYGVPLTYDFAPTDIAGWHRSYEA